MPKHKTIEVERGVRLTVDLYGVPGDRPPVLLLHGFPQSAYVWRDVGPALAERGFHAIAPDQRGYDRSDKPRGVYAYREPRLVDDLVALADGLGRRRLHVVAHDWGATVAWRLAALHPEIVDRLVILNGPHPDHYRSVIAHDPDQARRGRYVFFFQLPLLPEAALTRPGSLARMFRRTSRRPEVFTDADCEVYESAIRKPGAARGMVSWYRAAGRYPVRRPTPKVTCPTLVLWGLADEALSPSLSEGLDAYVDAARLRIIRFADASHWIVEEKPEEVTRAILEHLS